jgi:hypothetical protein
MWEVGKEGGAYRVFRRRSALTLAVVLEARKWCISHRMLWAWTVKWGFRIAQCPMCESVNNIFEKPAEKQNKKHKTVRKPFAEAGEISGR